jgi:predicted PurR-regulated permease PerM
MPHPFQAGIGGSRGRTITSVSPTDTRTEPSIAPRDDVVDRAVAAAPRVAFRAGLVLLGLVFAAWFVLQVSSVLLLAFMAVILAAALVGPVAWLEHRGLPGGLAVLAIYLVVALALGLLLFLVAPPLLTQLTQLLGSLPAIATTVLNEVQVLATGLGLQPDLSSLTGTAVSALRDASGLVTGVPLRLMGAVGDVLMILTLGAFIVLERRRARLWISRFLAPDDRSAFVALVDKAALRLAAYVQSQLVIMAVTGIGATLGLTLIGVPFALALGTFAFLTQIIPVVGPFLGGAAMIGVALLQSPAQAFLTLLLVIGLQQLTGSVLLPLLQGRLIAISPVVAILAVLFGGTLAGPIGAIVAVPAVAILSVIIDDIVLPWRRGEIRREAEAEKPAPDDGKTPRRTRRPARTG